MTPPSEYFERCAPGDPGAQRIGLEWFRFLSVDSLSAMLADDRFCDPSEVSDLRDRVATLEAEVEELEGQLEEDA